MLASIAGSGSVRQGTRESGNENAGACTGTAPGPKTLPTRTASEVSTEVLRMLHGGIASHDIYLPDRATAIRRFDGIRASIGAVLLVAAVFVFIRANTPRHTHH